MSSSDDDALQHGVNWLSIAFILLGLIAGLSTFLQMYMLTAAGARLTLRLREQVFEATLKQEMGWFDQSENAVGSLTARLSGDCSSVQGVSYYNSISMTKTIQTTFFFKFPRQRGVALALFSNRYQR